MNESFNSFSAELNASLRKMMESVLANLPKILVAMLVVAVMTFLGSRLSTFIRRRLSRKAHDQLFTTFIAQAVKYAWIVVALMLALQILDLSGIAGGLLAGAGVSALILGFAFRDIGENFLSGIILAFDRPFRTDDTIVINDFMGHVKGLNFRTTHIKTFDEKDVFIPNSIMVKQPLINLTRDGRLRLDFVVGIAYEDDIQEAVKLVLSTVNACEDILKQFPPFTVVEEFAPSTVNLRIYFWTDTTDYRKGVLLTKSRIMGRVKEALLAHGFTLPATVQELKLYDKSQALPIRLEQIQSPLSSQHKNNEGNNS